MDWRIYGIIIFLGLFVLILILNPKLSCFGKRIKSPLYPLFRKRKQKLKTEDYGFSLVDEKAEQKAKEKRQKLETQDYGFSRVDDAQQGSKEKKKKLKTHDYGFSLVDDNIKQKSKEKKPEDFGVHSESKVDSD